MKRLLRQIFRDVRKGENIDLIAIVVLVFVISLLDIFGVASQEQIASVTLATLGLLAIGLIVTRYKIEGFNIERDIANSVQFYSQNMPSLKTDLQNNNEIWMLGLMLKGTMFYNFRNFDQKVKEGTKLRVMIIDPNKVDMNNVARRFPYGKTAEEFRTDIRQTVVQLKTINKSARLNGGVQLRLLDFMPSFSLYVFPKAADGGIIYVDTYCYKSHSGSLPKYRVTEHENSKWYEHFISQFELMWQDAQVERLDETGEPVADLVSDVSPVWNKAN